GDQCVHSKSKSKRDPLKVYKRSATSLKVNAFFRARRLRLRDVYNRMGKAAIINCHGKIKSREEGMSHHSDVGINNQIVVKIIPTPKNIENKTM
ncbi:MAG TPA: hypothetical protein VF573_29605, partial [Paraburkholderia sp.]|uniref:hypothetical protein n=1 Tax=Paraburkholderia sp. TaxID=1926495 RepID=UPI002ED2A1D9